MAHEQPNDGMDMPCPCQKCHGWFDLHDGVGSTKWFPDTVICEQCAEVEQQEIETEEEIEDLILEIEGAEQDIATSKARLKELNAKLKLIHEHHFESNED